MRVYCEAEDGGAEGIRTPDLLIANQPLYQLSYDPIHKRSDPDSVATEPPWLQQNIPTANI